MGAEVLGVVVLDDAARAFAAAQRVTVHRDGATAADVPRYLAAGEVFGHAGIVGSEREHGAATVAERREKLMRGREPAVLFHVPQHHAVHQAGQVRKERGREQHAVALADVQAADVQHLVQGAERAGARLAERAFFLVHDAGRGRSLAEEAEILPLALKEVRHELHAEPRFPAL